MPGREAVSTRKYPVVRRIKSGSDAMLPRFQTGNAGGFEPKGYPRMKTSIPIMMAIFPSASSLTGSKVTFVFRLS
jgi:hypothetical protein